MRIIAFSLLILLSSCAKSPKKIIPPEFQRGSRFDGTGLKPDGFKPDADYFYHPVPEYFRMRRY